MSLLPCVHCQRHVRGHETSCPFCAGELEPRVTQRASGKSRLTRAAIFAGAGLLGACSSTDKKTDSIVVPSGDAAPIEGDREFADPPPPRAADAGPEVVYPDPNDIEHQKPYGAPPNRVRRA